jgi:hypothetical protein
LRLRRFRTSARRWLYILCGVEGLEAGGFVQVDGGSVRGGVITKIEVRERGLARLRFFPGRPATGSAARCSHAVHLGVLACYVAGNAHRGIDRPHRPARKSVQAFPVLAEDHLSKMVDEMRRKQGGTSLVGSALDLCKELFREAGLSREFTDHG